MMNHTVSLRRYQTEDAVQLTLLANNPNVVGNGRDNFPSPYELSDAHQWIDACRESKDNHFIQRAIWSGDTFVGGIGLIRQTDIHRNNAEIGYWLGEPFWGKGIMTEAVRQMSEWVFGNTSIHRLYAGVFSSNAASMRVLEKAGYDLEAVHRDAIFKNGKILDEHFYVRLRS